MEGGKAPSEILAELKLSEKVIEYTKALDVVEADQMTFAQKVELSTIALKEQAIAFLASPLGMATAVVAGIALIVGAIDLFTVSVEESREKLAELKAEYAEIQNELSNLNSELETTSERIDELLNKGSLSFTEKEELTNLQKQNNELARQIALLELERKLKQEEVNKSFVETMSKDLDQETYVLGYRRDPTDTTGRTVTAIYGTGKEYIQQQFDQYYANLDEIAALDEEYRNNQSDKTYQNLRKNLDEKNKRILEYFNEKNAEFADTISEEGIVYISNPTTAEEKAVNATLDYIYDFQDKYLIAAGSDSAKTNALDRLTSGQFAEATKQLQELGIAGQVTAEHLEDEAYQDFINKAIELGIISDDSTDSLADLALYFNQVKEAAKEATSSAEDTIVDRFS